MKLLNVAKKQVCACGNRYHMYPDGLCRDCHENRERRWVRETLAKACYMNAKIEDVRMARVSKRIIKQ